MSSYLSGIPAKSIASGTVAAVLVGVTAFGLVQIGVVFKRAITHFTPDFIKKNETAVALHASISDKLGTLFISTNVYNETFTKDVALQEKGKDKKDEAGNTILKEKSGDYKISNTSLILSGVALCLVALAGFKLMSYWSAGESPLNKVITYFSGVQVAPSSSYTAFNSLSDLKSKFI